MHAFGALVSPVILCCGMMCRVTMMRVRTVCLQTLIICFLPPLPTSPPPPPPPPAMEVFPTVAVTLDGVDPALDWLTSQLAIRLARDSYFPSASSISKAASYPVSFLKSSYLRVAGLLVAGGRQDSTDMRVAGET